ncbi:hypothetical protein EST38_g2087 [Candolleomyces aberdarensis]|uniref:DNA polymerase epsilon subunit D n=1 Tax=Candolleomyces aberdarensis TaxID=2316362 RepID=A0A4Q2DVT2_9AGAR|nr:hypothetical protein EST38_g2087 [Candolleomyces aberdarensis]
MPRKENPGPISAQAQQDLVSEGIENFELPKSVVMKIAKSALPEEARLTKETVLSLVKGSTVFINYLAATAHDVAVSKQHKSIAATDVLKALEMLDFADLVAPLSEELKTFKEQSKTTSGKKSGGANSKGFSISIPPSAGGSGSIRLPANSSNSASAPPITLKVKSKSSTASTNTPTDTGKQGASDSERNTPNPEDAEMADSET